MIQPKKKLPQIFFLQDCFNYGGLTLYKQSFDDFFQELLKIKYANTK
jgi:hypothetical protein